jgi:hypothetical protein
VSALTFYALIVVVSSIMFRSLQIVGGSGYQWDDLQAFNLSLHWLTALPIVVFGFQVGQAMCMPCHGSMA